MPASPHREQHQDLDPELADQARARRAERRSRRHFLHSGAGEREQQVRDVGARSDEHQHDGAKQQPQGTACRTEHRVRIRQHMQRLDALLLGAQRRPALFDGHKLRDRGFRRQRRT